MHLYAKRSNSAGLGYAVLTQDGLVTAAHNVRGAERVWVRLIGSEDWIECDVGWSSDDLDRAHLRPHRKIGIGSVTVAAKRPNVGDMIRTRLVTGTVVGYDDDGMMVTSVPVRQGLSGSGCYDLNNKLVGVLSYKRSDGRSGFACLINRWRPTPQPPREDPIPPRQPPQPVEPGPKGEKGDKGDKGDPGPPGEPADTREITLAIQRNAGAISTLQREQELIRKSLGEIQKGNREIEIAMKDIRLEIQRLGQRVGKIEKSYRIVIERKN